MGIYLVHHIYIYIICVYNFFIFLFFFFQIDRINMNSINKLLEYRNENKNVEDLHLDFTLLGKGNMYNCDHMK